MFDISNEEVIIRLIDNSDDIIFPLYIKIYNETYSLLELDKITTCNSFSFKIGFGNKTSPLQNSPKIPLDKILGYDSRNIITKYDEKTQMNIRYIIFESRRVDDDGSLINAKINEYYDMLFDYVMNNIKKAKSITAVDEN